MPYVRPSRPVLFALATAALPILAPHANAQQSAAPVQVQATRDYAIAAGPLDEVLSQIARHSGQSIAAEPALVRGKRAGGKRSPQFRTGAGRGIAGQRFAGAE